MLILLLIVVAVVGVVLALGRGRGSAASTSQAAPSGSAALPETLPVAVKRFFFSRSEQSFYGVLSAALEGTPYTTFPNVRLNDLFEITDAQQRQSTYNRLRDKHVDFLIVTRERCTPALAIELDGDSHAKPLQQERDRVKDLIFRSAGLTLLRLDAGQGYQPGSLRERLHEHLPELAAGSVSVGNPRTQPAERAARRG